MCLPAAVGRSRPRLVTNDTSTFTGTGRQNIILLFQAKIEKISTIPKRIKRVITTGIARGGALYMLVESLKLVRKGNLPRTHGLFRGHRFSREPPPFSEAIGFLANLHPFPRPSVFSRTSTLARGGRRHPLRPATTRNDDFFRGHRM